VELKTKEVQMLKVVKFIILGEEGDVIGLEENGCQDE